MAATPAGNTTQPDRLVGFLDILFGAGLGLHFNVLATRTWFTDPTAVLLLGNAAEVFLVFTIYVWMILSWWASRSPRTAPPSFELFVTDVGIMIVYFLILTSFRNLGSEVWLFAIAFGLFVAWDYFRAKMKSVEYGSPRDTVTLFWFVMFLAIALLFYGGFREDTVAVGLLFAGTILYRLHKERPWFLS